MPAKLRKLLACIGMITETTDGLWDLRVLDYRKDGRHLGLIVKGFAKLCPVRRHSVIFLVSDAPGCFSLILRLVQHSWYLGRLTLFCIAL